MKVAHVNSQGVALLEVWPYWSKCGLNGVGVALWEVFTEG